MTDLVTKVVKEIDVKSMEHVLLVLKGIQVLSVISPVILVVRVTNVMQTEPAPLV